MSKMTAFRELEEVFIFIKFIYDAHQNCCESTHINKILCYLFPTEDGELFVWGKNSSGQLGLGKSNNIISFLQTPSSTIDGCTPTLCNM